MILALSHVVTTSCANAPPAPRQLSSAVQKVALGSLAEFVFSLTLGLTVSLFSATLHGSLLIFGALSVQTILHIALRSLGAACNWPLETVCPYSFTLLTALNGQTLIHESGHVLAAMSLYKKSKPFIEIDPFYRVFSSYKMAEPNWLGKVLGKERSSLAICAAGPLLSLSISSLMLYSSVKLESKHPALSSYLKTAALFDFALHSAYALSALRASSLSHDFVRLASYGLPPVAAAVAIAGLPLLLLRASS
jgi:hypothetical protein